MAKYDLLFLVSEFQDGHHHDSCNHGITLLGEGENYSSFPWKNKILIQVFHEYSLGIPLTSLVSDNIIEIQGGNHHSL